MIPYFPKWIVKSPDFNVFFSYCDSLVLCHWFSGNKYTLTSWFFVGQMASSVTWHQEHLVQWPGKNPQSRHKFRSQWLSAPEEVSYTETFRKSSVWKNYHWTIKMHIKKVVEYGILYKRVSFSKYSFIIYLGTLMILI